MGSRRRGGKVCRLVVGTGGLFVLSICIWVQWMEVLTMGWRSGEGYHFGIGAIM